MLERYVMDTNIKLIV